MRRLEDKIRGLCARVVSAKGDEELRSSLVELRSALREHIERVRSRLAAYPFGVERRVKGKFSPPEPPP